MASPALRRLQRDLRTLERDPLPFCAAAPAETNLLEWSATFVARDGKWAGIPVHVHLRFPESYPNNPPTVEMITRGFEHPNVFGGFICLDMLRHHADRPYRGWSAGYTAAGVLTQLYGFLLADDVIEQDYGGRAVSRHRYHLQRDTYKPYILDEGRQQLTALSGRRCVLSCHCQMRDIPAPPADLLATDESSLSSTSRVSTKTLDDGSNASSPDSSSSYYDGIGDVSLGASTTSGSVQRFGALCPDLIRSVVGHLDDVSDLHNLRKAAGGSAPAGAAAAQRLLELNLFCFHSKLRHDEGYTVLGYGLDVVHYGPKSRDGIRRQPKLVCRVGVVSRGFLDSGAEQQAVKKISLAGYDYLSLSAFEGEDKVRLSAWNQQLNAFLPLYLNPAHGRRSLAVLYRHVSAMLGPAYRSMPKTGKLLFCFGKLMNSLIIDLFLRTGGQDKRHMCDAAIEAFFHMHHMLLAVALEDNTGSENVVLAAQCDIINFVESPQARHKNKCPDLGVLLLKLLLVPADTMPWARFAPVFVRELLARQVRWVDRTNAKGFEYLKPHEDENEGDDIMRINHHLEHAATSLRIVAMETWFANAVSRPESHTTASQELLGIKEQLDTNHGQPPQAVRDAFWGTFKTFEAGKCFSDYMNRMGVCPKPRPTHSATLACMLRQAVVDSKEAGYHEGWIKSMQYIDWSSNPLDVYQGPWLRLMAS